MGEVAQRGVQSSEYRLVPSVLHEMLVATLRERPSVVAALVGETLGRGTVCAIAPLETLLGNDLVPPSRAVDVALEVEVDRARINVLFEVQLARDDEKQWSWPLYVASTAARHRRRTALVVVTLDEGTERWAATPFDWMVGGTFAPIVIASRVVC